MNTRNLRKRGKGWAAVYYIPDHLQELAAKATGSKRRRLKEIVRGLDTRDLNEANKKKHVVLAQVALEVARLDDPTLEALELSKDPGWNQDVYQDHALDRAKDIEKTHGTVTASRYYKIATRQGLPVSVALEEWMNATDGIDSGTRDQYKRDVEVFIEWAGDPYVKDCDDDLAANFYRYTVNFINSRTRKPFASNTVKRKIGSLNRLWSQMRLRQGFKGHNPWPDLLQLAPGEKRKNDVAKTRRAFTKEEAQAYLKGVQDCASKYKVAGANVITLFWHTGIRPEDICNLTTKQVLWDEEEGVMWLTVLKGKTEGNTRVLPVISPEAINILHRRLEGAIEGLLFHEVPIKGKKTVQGRYQTLQKPINTVRRKVLPDPELDTYALRHTFSAACEDAGLDPVQWSRLMGHTAPTLASAVYNRGHEGRLRLLNGIRKVHKELGELSEEQPF